MTFENWWNNQTIWNGWTEGEPDVLEIARKAWGMGYHEGYEDGGKHERDLQDQRDMARD